MSSRGAHAPKTLFSKSGQEETKNQWLDLFPHPMEQFGPLVGGHIGFSWQCGIAGGERVPLGPLGCYFLSSTPLPWSMFCQNFTVNSTIII